MPPGPPAAENTGAIAFDTETCIGVFVDQFSIGFFLTQDDTRSAFAIILHNVRTYRSGGVVAVIQGKRNAESSLKDFQTGQSPSDYHEGWRYFIEKTDLVAGTDPGEATHRRQADLERREAKETPSPTGMRPINFPK